jgi:hypothetical protein
MHVFKPHVAGASAVKPRFDLPLEHANSPGLGGQATFKRGRLAQVLRHSGTQVLRYRRASHHGSACIY